MRLSIVRNSKTDSIGSIQVLFSEEVDSTNTEAARQLAVGRTRPFVISADRQTKSRGRFDRQWVSPAGNLSMTIAVALPRNRYDTPVLSLVTGLAISDVLETVLPSSARLSIKWPNDVLIDDGKVSGTLIEVTGLNAFVGIGVNIVTHPETTIYPTTSLDRYCMSSRDELVGLITAEWFRRFETWLAHGFKALAQDYSAKLWRLNEPLSVSLDAERSVRKNGLCVGVNEHGHLMLQDETGQVAPIHVGDVLAPLVNEAAPICDDGE
ncbi:biotin--[acetyl-CoA-carboxylase] ligase [Ochrobactrum sp. XJ1]|nr:biotin--[acetyl-CoA-carboxylase] ligase [Ochrobactrum sp. XJ1]